jgi:hypothetical protein
MSLANELQDTIHALQTNHINHSLDNNIFPDILFFGTKINAHQDNLFA